MAGGHLQVGKEPYDEHLKPFVEQDVLLAVAYAHAGPVRFGGRNGVLMKIRDMELPLLAVNRVAIDGPEKDREEKE